MSIIFPLNTRKAVHEDIPRIMAIRHSVHENRLRDLNVATAAHCAAFIDGAEIWVWVEQDVIQGFAAGDPDELDMGAPTFASP